MKSFFLHLNKKHFLTILMFGLGFFAYTTSANAVTTDCSSNLSTPGTYNIVATTTHTCNITTSGVTINGGASAIVHTPQAFPNNAGSGGWIDMTDNALLYHMDDTGGNIVDSSGNGLTGTVNGGVTYGASGKVGNAISFDGNSGYIDAGNVLNFDSSFTISLWAYFNNTSGYRELVAKSGNAADWDFQTESGVFKFYIVTTNGGYSVSSVTVAQTGKWYHTAVVWDKANSLLKLYVNGVLEGSASVGGDRITNSNDLCIGQSCVWGGRYLNGSLDEISVWTRALSDSDVSSIYNNQLGGVTVSGNLIGPVAQPLPDNASSTAWTNMTGNRLLYHMNEQIGATDSVGGNALIPTGNVTAVTGKFGNAVNFNGSGASMSTQSNATAQSLTAWVKFNSFTGGYEHMIRGDDDGFCFGVASDNHWVGCGSEAGSGPTLGQWYFVAIVQGQGVYINGAITSAGVPPGLGGQHKLNLGGPPYGEWCSSCSIDELGLWSGTLTQSQITAMYNSGAGTVLTGSESGLVDLYHFNQSTFSPSISDTSGQGNTGTVNGSVVSMPGVISGALKTDGSSGVITSQPLSGFDSSASHTVLTWIHVDDPDQSGNYGAVAWTLGGTNCNGNPVANVNNGNLNINPNCTGYFVPMASMSTLYNSWHLIGYTYDGSSQNIITYLDGNQHATGNYGFAGDVGSPIAVGANWTGQGSFSQFFNGRFDEFSVWNRVLSPTEISNIYLNQAMPIAFNGNGNSFNLTNVVTYGLIASPGAMVTITNSTVAMVNVTGADNTGNGQAGGTINLTNSNAGALIANGGDSTDDGVGGAAGTINLTNSIASSETANPGHCGPNATDPSCINIFNNADGTGDWDDPANWSNDSVPGSSDTVKIDANLETTSMNDASVANITFENGADLSDYCEWPTINVTGTTTFTGGGYMYCATVNTSNLVVNDGSYIEGGYVNGNGTGNAYFDGSSSYNGMWSTSGFNTFVFTNGANNQSYIPGNATFDGGSYNQNSEIDGNATFTNGSYDNYGYLYGQDYFYDTSYAQGTNFYNSSPIFYGNSSEYYPGSTNGIDLTRYYNTNTSVGSLDFTSSGAPWIITADNAAVDLSQATCNANTVFLAINGGSFTYGPNCLSGPEGVSIVSPTSGASLSTWSPLVDWNQGAGGYDYTGCQYSFGTSTDWDGANNDWFSSSPEYGTWNGISCTDDGATTINAPPHRGEQILAIRGVYNGNNATTSSAIVDFTYIPTRLMYFYAGSDAAWSDSANWYTDSTHTTPADDVPTAADKVTILGTTSPSVDVDAWTQPALINSGTTGVVFTSSATTSVSVAINGTAAFDGSTVYSGSINGSTVFNDTASNAGTIKNNAIFNSTASNAGSVLGNATFNGDLSSNAGTIRGIKTRYYTATTTTVRNLVGWTVVANGVTVDVSSATHDATTVFRTVNGGSFIGGPTTVYWWSDGSDTQWGTLSHWFSDAATTTPLGAVGSSTDIVEVLGSHAPTIDLATTSWQTPDGIDASRTGIIITSATTDYIDTGITGSTTFLGHAVNESALSGDAFFYADASNDATGTISGTAHFFDTAYNDGGTLSGDAVFNDSSYNTNGGTIAGNATFNDGSHNDTSAGLISGTATFNNNAYNSGTIANDAVFTGNYTENTGTVQGTQTRYWNTSTTTTRDFVSTGPWTLVADGATVTVDSSAVFSTTTTFTTLNGGHFVGEGLPGSTTCTKPLIFPGTYTLSGDISNTCTIESNGVILNGAGYAIGHTPEALPNGGGSSGWMDMTDNVALYHFDESSGSTVAVDSSGNGNDLTQGGSFTFGQPGTLGTAVSFNGQSGSDLWIRDASFTLNPNDQFTISLWVKSNSDNTAGSAYFSQDQDYISGNGFNTAITSYSNANNTWNDPLGITFETGANWVDQNNVTSAELPDYNWHLVTATYNQGEKTLYIDGVQVAQTFDSQNLTATPMTDSLTSVGTWICGDNGWQCVGNSNSSVDELAVWKRALSPTEVANMYATQSTGIGVIGNGYDFSLSDITVGGSISSPGATIDVANSTVGMINVSGADAAGDAQAGGTIDLTDSTTAGALIANGGNSTDYGYGGAAGTITLDNTSSAASQTANAGSDGPNIGAGQKHNPPSNGGGSSGGSSNQIAGCTDPSASNYNSLATVDNGSCRYPTSQVRGCTDPSASNYNASATINDGSCRYPTYNPYTPPSNSGAGSGNGNNAGAGNGSINVSFPISSFGGSFSLPPLQATPLQVNTVGSTYIGNPLANIKTLGTLQLTPINFNLGSVISNFLFAPLPKSITDALDKSPKLADMVASVGVSTEEDLVQLSRQPIQLVPSGGSVPGLFIVGHGSTTIPTYVAYDKSYDLVQLVYAHPGDILNIDLVPLSKGKVVGTFNGDRVVFFQSPNKSFEALITAPTSTGRYFLKTASAPLPLAVQVLAPPPPPHPVKATPVPWWKKVVNWFLKPFSK
jgi:Concanavalin A-like lectin/glucanases superfamily